MSLKSKSVMLGSIKLKNSVTFRFPINLNSANLGAESDCSNFGAEVCGDEETDCILCFYGPTGCPTFRNVEN